MAVIKNKQEQKMQSAFPIHIVFVWGALWKSYIQSVKNVLVLIVRSYLTFVMIDYQMGLKRRPRCQPVFHSIY